MWINCLLIFQARDNYIMRVLSSLYSCWKQKSCHFLTVDLYVKKFLKLAWGCLVHTDKVFWTLLNIMGETKEQLYSFVKLCFYFNIYIYICYFFYYCTSFSFLYSYWMDLFCSLVEKSFDVLLYLMCIPFSLCSKSGVLHTYPVWGLESFLNL